MAKKRSSKKTQGSAATKPTRDALAKAAKKHFPHMKTALEKVLKNAGFGGVRVRGVNLQVDEKSVLDQCSPPCGSDETCLLSSNGTWVCVPSS
jgi:hypothetical protein